MNPLVGWLRSLGKEAGRRRVYTTIAAYVALSLVLIQLGEAIFNALLFPEWSIRLLTMLLVLGLPVVVVLAWAFDIGPGGVMRTDATKETGAGSQAATPGGGLRALPRTRAPHAHTHAHADLGSKVSTAQSAALLIEPVAPDPARVRETALSHARHELRTPINAIIGYSEMLLEDARESGAIALAGDLEHIRSAGRDLLTRVDRVLDPARLVREPTVDLDGYGAQIRVDLRDPTTAVIGYAEMLLEEDVPGMRADLERILGAARSLLELSTDIVRLATQPDAARAALGAADTIAAGVLAQIHPVTGREHEEERQGSLLVVDDNPLNRDLLSRQLARKGYVVATCENGREALERLERDSFDVVLLDIMMPEIDGVEVLRRIRTNPRHVGLPVIMISSLNEIDGAIRCLEMGAADYLTKPFHPTLLDARIGAVLEARRLREREAHYLRQLEDEQGALNRLVLGACPPAVAERVRRGETDWVERYLEIAVLSCDLGRGLGNGDPAARAAALTRRLALVDDAALEHGLGTVLRAGSAVLVAGGVSAPRTSAARDVASCARALADALAADGGVSIGMGLHAGSAFGGMVGRERLGFQLWGEPVDVARALEAIAPPGAICVSPTVHAQVREEFDAASLGVVDVGGGTQMRAYRLGTPIVR